MFDPRIGAPECPSRANTQPAPDSVAQKLYGARLAIGAALHHLDPINVDAARAALSHAQACLEQGMSELAQLCERFRLAPE